MSIIVSVITTANHTRRFTLNSADSINHLLDILGRSALIFSGKPLIIGSATQTELFSVASVACIELETARDLEAYMPGDQTMALCALASGEALLPFIGGLEGAHYKARIDFYFQGGHVLHTLAEGERKAALAERLMNLTGVFDRPVIAYRLPQGGIGLMNPQAMIRAVITPGVPDLPKDAWVADVVEG